MQENQLTEQQQKATELLQQLGVILKERPTDMVSFCLHKNKTVKGNQYSTAVCGSLPAVSALICEFMDESPEHYRIVKVAIMGFESVMNKESILFNQPKAEA